MNKYKIGEKVNINSESDRDIVIDNYVDSTGYIEKFDASENGKFYIVNDDNTFGWWFNRYELTKIEDSKPILKPPPDPQETVFIPTCSSCINNHLLAMAGPCRDCYGGLNSNFVFMGWDTTQGWIDTLTFKRG